MLNSFICLIWWCGVSVIFIPLWAVHCLQSFYRSLLHAWFLNWTVNLWFKEIATEKTLDLEAQRKRFINEHTNSDSDPPLAAWSRWLKSTGDAEVRIYYANKLCEGAVTKTSHEFYIEFNGILLIGNGRIQHANYCCIISLIGKYLHGVGWDHCILFIFCSTFYIYFQYIQYF